MSRVLNNWRINYSKANKHYLDKNFANHLSDTMVFHCNNFSSKKTMTIVIFERTDFKTICAFYSLTGSQTFRKVTGGLETGSMYVQYIQDMLTLHSPFLALHDFRPCFNSPKITPQNYAAQGVQHSSLVAH